VNIHGCYRRPAYRNTTTSLYGVSLTAASAAQGCANAVIAWMQWNGRAADTSGIKHPATITHRNFKFIAQKMTVYETWPTF